MHANGPTFLRTYVCTCIRTHVRHGFVWTHRNWRSRNARSSGASSRKVPRQGTYLRADDQTHKNTTTTALWLPGRDEHISRTKKTKETYWWEQLNRSPQRVWLVSSHAQQRAIACNSPCRAAVGAKPTPAVVVGTMLVGARPIGHKWFLIFIVMSSSMVIEGPMIIHGLVNNVHITSNKKIKISVTYWMVWTCISCVIFSTYQKNYTTNCR